MFKDNIINVKSYLYDRIVNKWAKKVTLILKRYGKFTGAILAGLTLLATAVCYQNEIMYFLLSKNANSDNILMNRLSNLFTAIGAAMLGVLAITFSISLFAIQQAADKHTAILLNHFATDKKTSLIFWSIALLSCFILINSFVVSASFIFWQLVLCLLALGMVLVLIKIQYQHTIHAINPIFLINDFLAKGINDLLKIDKRLEKTAKKSLKGNHDLENIKNTKSALILNTPHLFDGTALFLGQISVLIITYFRRKDYHVTQTGFDALNFIIYKYIDVKKDSFFPGTPISCFDYSNDAIITEVLEKLTSIQQAGIQEKDLEFSKQIIKCFSNIAFHCLKINYSKEFANEYTHASLTIAYMQKNIEDAIRADIPDVGLYGIDILGKCGSAFISRDATTDCLTVASHLKKISKQGMSRPQTIYLTNDSLRIFSLLLRETVLLRYYDSNLMKLLLKDVEEIILSYIIYGKPDETIAVSGAVGHFLDLSNPWSMPYLFDHVVETIRSSSNDDENQKLLKVVVGLTHELWRFYDVLAKSAAPQESFLLHYIDSNLHHICERMLDLHSISQVDENLKKDIRSEIGCLLSVYWRIYDYHSVITKNYYFNILEHLLMLGAKFSDKSMAKEFNQVVDIIISIAKSFSEKEQVRYGYTPIRILEEACCLCILNGSEAIWKRNAPKITRVLATHTTKYSQHRGLLCDELLNMKSEHARTGWGLSFDNELIHRLDGEKIKKFVEIINSELDQPPQKKTGD